VLFDIMHLRPSYQMLSLSSKPQITNGFLLCILITILIVLSFAFVHSLCITILLYMFECYQLSLSLWFSLMALSIMFYDRYCLPISQIFRQRVHWFYPADTREIFLKLLKSKASWLISVILK
jgi:hypothetical protein